MARLYIKRRPHSSLVGYRNELIATIEDILLKASRDNVPDISEINASMDPLLVKRIYCLTVLSSLYLRLINEV